MEQGMIDIDESCVDFFESRKAWRLTNTVFGPVSEVRVIILGVRQD